MDNACMYTHIFSILGGSDMKKLRTAVLMIMFLTVILSIGTIKASEAADRVKIGLSMAERDQWLSSLETAVVNAAKEKQDVDFTAFDSQRDVQKQIDHVNTFASQNFDAIIINLVEESNTEGIIKAAGKIPVIFVNRTPDPDYLVPGQTAYVGSNEEHSGGLQAQFLAEYFKYKEPKTLRYVLFMGILGLPHTNMRTQSVKDGLEAAGFTLERIFEDTAEFDRAIAMAKMQQFLGTGRDFDVVIANNDEMALGAIEAMKVVGKTGIPVVGIDATPSALDVIESGELTASVFQDATGQGAGAFELAYKVAKGGVLEAEKWIPFELVTKENYLEYKPRSK